MIPLCIILGILLLILLLPVGVIARYDGEVGVRAAIGPFRLQILPAKPKTRKQLEKERQKKEKKAQAKAEKKKKAEADKLIKKDEPEKPKFKEPLKDKLAGLLPFARLAVDALGSVFRRLKIRQLTVRVRMGGSDPAKLAQSYGKAQAAVSAMLPLLAGRFRIKKKEISIQPDFLAKKTEVEAVLSLRYLVFDLLGIALKYGFRGLKLLLRRKKQQKAKQEAFEAEEKSKQAELENQEKAVGQ